ncbi:MAG: hypothetical protein QM756_39145 [Polyangiaceae bacterium]
MLERRLVALRVGLLASLGFGATWSCGGNTSDDPSAAGANSGGRTDATKGGAPPASADSGGSSAIPQGGSPQGGAPAILQGGSSGGPAVSCSDAVEGYQVCSTGWTVRASPAACQNTLPNFFANGGAGGERGSEAIASGVEPCRSHADCTAAPWGYCAAQFAWGASYFHCYYGCADDSDCESGSVCFCGGSPSDFDFERRPQRNRRCVLEGWL